MWKPIVGLLTLMIILPMARAADGWSTFGNALGGGSRSDAYDEGRRQAAEQIAAIEEARVRQLEAESRVTDERIRNNLMKAWISAGFPEQQAAAIAETYQWTDAQDAIIDGVRRRGASTAIPPLRAALRDYNYPLANQLLVAYLVISREEAARRPAPTPPERPADSR